MGCDRGDVIGPGGVPSPGRATDHGDDGETRGRQRVGVTLSISVNGSRGDPPHQGVYQEAGGDHSGKGSLPPHT